ARRGGATTVFPIVSSLLLSCCSPGPIPSRIPIRIEDEPGRSGEVTGHVAVSWTPKASRVEEDGAETRAAGAQHVHRVEVADIYGLVGGHAGALEAQVKDLRIRLLDAHDEAADDEVERVPETGAVEERASRAV